MLRHRRTGFMEVRLTSIDKYFGTLKALDTIDFTIAQGSFFTLLGPSGCGKTTLLRTLAGFYSPDSGEIRFGDRRIDQVPAHKREIGMVFQNYALFPHLSVFDNVAYGLRARRTSASEIRDRVMEMLAAVHLEDFATRAPNQLSGGQQQRVALARALVIRPEVLLMDEPLSNLDAKLRVSMRDEIRRIQQDLGITTVYVTHDQEEAMAVSDAIAVMKGGQVQQIGTPMEIYLTPKNRFVAEFMGASNILPGMVTEKTDGADCQCTIDGVPFRFATAAPAGECLFSIRPERLRITDRSGENTFSGTISHVSFLGAMVRYHLNALGQKMHLEIHAPDPARLCRVGDTVRIAVDADAPVALEA